MKKINLMIAIAMSLIVYTTPSYALTIGFSSPNFDDNFQTMLREAAKKRAESLGHRIQIEDAREDVGTQISHIQNFIASGVDAIVLAAVDTNATPQMTKMAKNASIPIVYINREPTDVGSFDGKSAVYVGSPETWSGTFEAFELCRLAGGVGKAVILVGILSNEAAVTRTKDVEEVLQLSMCSGIKVVEKQVAGWQRVKANDMVTNWLSSGLEFNIVFANNDEMALGALQALKAAGVSMDDVLVGGVDATPDALASMKAGELDVTVFQNAAGQAVGGVDAAVDMLKGKKLPNYLVIPFELVTPKNMNEFM